MLYYLIPQIIIAVSLVTIAVIIVKKFPALASLNVTTIPEEKENQVRNRILLERLQRKGTEALKRADTFTKPLREKTAGIMKQWYQRMLQLEQEVVQKKQPLKSFEIKQEVTVALEKAEELLDEEKYQEAEEAYIEIISLDANNYDAYEGLVEVYIENRDYKKARETARYLIKLISKKRGKEYTREEKGKLAVIYYDLGRIYELEHKQQSAMTNYQKAIEFQPNNPKFLDSLLKISIILRNKDLAWKTFNALEEADPENKKLAEIRQEIEKIAQGNT